ncbi:Rpp14/Pop5 family protein [Methanonatronarchaeum sp. AMET-Sl]|uniref:Rpp14/Pop5 family protein n=1 Tax=Methanonatronarchaeum sp. AMET-Sl TaxID=3037654 RepID=UPI00244DD623|nr:Rpp14/Pop5 family protein [Methanonatronarchaeum sp. AMET-Sl]WGI16901.1 Rpp14/Pop5 family protein [Methanonatronarchaeum sp. AMET-Sl]
MPVCLRESRRYLAVRVVCDGDVGRGDLVHGVWGTAVSLLGDVEAGESGLWIYGFDGRFLVVGCYDGYVDRVSGVLACVRRVDGVRVRLDVLGVSGTMKKLKKRFIQKQDE